VVVTSSHDRVIGVGFLHTVFSVEVALRQWKVAVHEAERNE